MACGVLYIIGKLLERRCLKWSRILDIWNTSYGQKKGRSQTTTLTPDYNKLEIDPIYLIAEGVWHAIGSFRQYLQLHFRPHCDLRFTGKIMGPQSRGSPIWRDFGTPTWESWERKVIWM
jgi:hypothetical protein